MAADITPYLSVAFDVIDHDMLLKRLKFPLLYSFGRVPVIRLKTKEMLYLQ